MCMRSGYEEHLVENDTDFKHMQRTLVPNKHKDEQDSLEDDIGVFLLSQNIGCLGLFRRWSRSSWSVVLRFFLRCLLSGCKNLGICLGDVSLLLARDLLEAVKLLTVELVKFGVDVCVFISMCDVDGNRRVVDTFDGIFSSRDDNVLAEGNVRIKPCHC